MGIWNHECNLRELGLSVDMWITINSEVLLFSFLPVLIFASGLSTNMHIFFKVISQCIILAGPGVGIGALLTAIVTRFIFSHHWDWNVSMLFGSILSATDPVAVVALLKELGASPRLGTVIEGESLLNDGVGFVFFNLFLSYAKGTNSICYGHDSTCTNVKEASGIISYFLQVSLGGPTVGLAFAIVTIAFINITNDVITEITLTLALAYLSFFVADFTSGKPTSYIYLL